MRNKILDYLRRKPGYASGEEISRNLGISRQALWKHIQELKEDGFEIEAVPHLGYHLSGVPDRLFSSEVANNLDTQFIGEKIYYFEEVSSTMDKAVELGQSGAPEGTLVLSEVQKKGRGRLGREWVSPKYKGIYLSLILRPKIAPAQAPVLTLLSAVSVCQALKESLGLNAQIKWPNDILIQNKKVGGILTELNAEMDEVRFVAMGIGINVNNEKKNLLPQATSLKEQKGEGINRVALLQEILRRLEENYLVFQKKGAEEIISRWRDFNVTLGKRVKVVYHANHLEGQAVDIDTDGALLLRNDAGLTQRVTAGDIVHCR